MTERQRNITAAALTVIFLGLTCIVLIFFGLRRPFPPLPEYGVEVNLGNSMDGMGDIQPEAIAENAYSAPSSQASSENIVSQHDSDVALQTKTKPKPKSDPKPTEASEQETPQQPTENQQPTINQAALFPPKKSAQSGGEGITDKPGDQGQPDGTKDGTAYAGTPGSGGGISFNLSGRKPNQLAKPSYDSPDQGTVVVKIWVDAAGHVFRAEAGQRGTTVNDRSLWQTAETAAKKSSFTPDKNAPEQQVGTITYRFIKLN